MQRHAEVKYLLVCPQTFFVVLGFYVYLSCSQLRPALSFSSLSLSVLFLRPPRLPLCSTCACCLSVSVCLWSYSWWEGPEDFSAPPSEHQRSLSCCLEAGQRPEAGGKPSAGVCFGHTLVWLRGNPC